MKKTVSALALVLSILVMFGVQSVQLVEANGYIITTITNGPPTITIQSPLNNEIVTFNTVVFAFTLTKPDYNWTSKTGTSNRVVYVNITLDGIVYLRVDVNSELSVPFTYSLNLTDLKDGAHNVQLNVFCRGVSTTYMNP